MYMFRQNLIYTDVEEYYLKVVNFQSGMILTWYLPIHFLDRGFNKSSSNRDVTGLLICVWYLPLQLGLSGRLQFLRL